MLGAVIHTFILYLRTYLVQVMRVKVPRPSDETTTMFKKKQLASYPNGASLRRAKSKLSPPT